MRRRVYVDDCEFGQGVFSAVPLRKRDVAFFITGRIVTAAENMKLPEEGSYSIQVDSNTYIDPVSPSRFINHCCDPNVGLRDDYTVIALRPIRAGEELRFDYSTTMLERMWSMDCQCGTEDCREEIGDFDLLPEKLQRYYLSEGVVQRFIVDQLSKRAQTAA